MLPAGLEPAMRDHPRSRGVYKWWLSVSDEDDGSSPLARGLLRFRLRRGVADGIIPARAGFTRCSPSLSLPSGDHPRSRGVYASQRSWGSADAGSSPLARGLHEGAVDGAQEAGIIPARAGFTGRLSTGRSPVRDHPRSRGVYGGVVGRAERCAGSSPLARGLHQTGHLIAPVRGIIPARTGFTSLWRPCRLPWLDHPRSRGVYRTVRRRQFALAGSSPLARGLPGEVAHGAFGARIIPARAGFTGAS